VDEYRLMVYPVILGSGKRLFEEGSNRIALKLTETRPIGNGILILIYHPEIDVKTIQSEPGIEREKERSQP